MHLACRITLAALTFALLAHGTALAWNQRGHRITASIAFRQLSPDVRARVAQLLRSHPRFADDFQGRMPPDIASADPETQDEWIFQQAAYWPDIAREYRGDLACQFHRPTWHYVNKPVWLTPADAAAIPNPPLNADITVPAAEYARYSMNVIQAIKHSRSVVADASRHDADRALHLAWLFHTVGDIHQPLHAAALVSADRFPEGDRGGNDVETTQQGNLHALWDRFPGNDAAFAACRNEAIDLAADPALVTAADMAAMQLDPDAWLAESHTLADTAVYDAEVRTLIAMLPPGSKGPITVGPTYLATGGQLSRRQLTIAGFRLAEIVEALP
jgi:S1/P1 Nuclease